MGETSGSDCIAQQKIKVVPFTERNTGGGTGTGERHSSGLVMAALASKGKDQASAGERKPNSIHTDHVTLHKPLSCRVCFLPEDEK